VRSFHHAPPGNTTLEPVKHHLKTNRQRSALGNMGEAQGRGKGEMRDAKGEMRLEPWFDLRVRMDAAGRSGAVW
jgi:hypothetical protein